MEMANGNHSSRRARQRTLLFSMLLVAGFGVVVSPQVQLNVCGCANNPCFAGDLGQHRQQHLSTRDDYHFRFTPSATAGRWRDGIQRHQSGRQAGRAGCYYIHP